MMQQMFQMMAMQQYWMQQQAFNQQQHHAQSHMRYPAQDMQTPQVAVQQQINQNIPGASITEGN